MGFLNGNVSFSLFEIVDGAVLPTVEEYYRKIKSFSFDPARPAAEKMGWTSIENVLDAGFENNLTDGSRYRLFALRIDRQVIPAAVVKMRCLEEQARLLASNGQKKLYREQRESIHESVCVELKKAIPPTPRVYEVIWNVEEGLVYFGSLSVKVMDDFVSLFRETFGILLRPVRANHSPVSAAEIDPSSIGREFLTWLWFKTEENDGGVIVLPIFSVEVFFVHRVALEAGEGEYAEIIVCQGQHADLREGKEALRQGKKISEARIKLHRDDNEYEFTYRANGFQYQTMRVPALQEAETEEDKAGMVLERIYLLEMAVDTIGYLYAMFLNLRLSGSEWQDEAARMHRWLSREGRDHDTRQTKP